jgi:hypothetical protein
MPWMFGAVLSRVKPTKPVVGQRDNELGHNAYPSMRGAMSYDLELRDTCRSGTRVICATR